MLLYWIISFTLHSFSPCKSLLFNFTSTFPCNSLLPCQKLSIFIHLLPLMTVLFLHTLTSPLAYFWWYNSLKGPIWTLFSWKAEPDPSTMPKWALALDHTGNWSSVSPDQSAGHWGIILPNMCYTLQCPDQPFLLANYLDSMFIFISFQTLTAAHVPHEGATVLMPLTLFPSHGATRETAFVLDKIQDLNQQGNSSGTI